MIKDTNNIQILVITDDENIKNQAIELNVNFVLDSQTAIKKIKNGWTDFDIVVITPEMMGKVGCLGKYLGQQGKMPCPKNGTVVHKDSFYSTLFYIQYLCKVEKPNPADYPCYASYRYAYHPHIRSYPVTEFLIETIYRDYYRNNVDKDEIIL